jgi:putative ABC transport system permease protein
MKLFRLLSWPYLRKHFFRWTLTITGIVLGVAVYVGMNSVNESVKGAFSETVQRLAGETQLQVTSGEVGFDEAVLERVQGVSEVGIAVPVIEATADTGLPGQGSLLILGVDMTGDRSLRDYTMESADDAIIEDPLIFLAQPDSLMVTREFAERNNLLVNDKIPLQTIDGKKSFTIRGVMRSTGMNKAFGGNLAVMDIYAAQLVFGRGRRFDRIDLRARDGVAPDDCRQAVQRELGPGFEVEPPSSRTEHFASLLQSYTLATQISSVFALIVGMFIIYNSFSIAVTQRRGEIGILRALGATQRQIRRVFLIESVLAGLVGSSIGAIGGMIVARALAESMAAIIRQQVSGAGERTTEIAINPWLVLTGILIGVATSIIAAWIPARSASAVDPVKALQKGKYQVIAAGESRKRRRIAMAFVVISIAALALGSWKPAFYAGYLLMIVASLLFAPTLTLILARLLRPFLRRLLPVEGTLAADSLIQAPRRTSATVAALMLSLAMAMGFGGVTDSMRTSIEEWMTNALNPDFFVAPSASLTSRSFTFPPEIGSVLERVPGVKMVQLVRSARVMYGNVPVMIVSVETEKLKDTVRRRPIAGDLDEMYRLTAAGKGVMISDAFQAHHHLKLGDVVSIPVPRGVLSLPVVGIIRDYSDLQGAVFVDRTVYVREWDDPTVNVARVYLNAGENPASVQKGLREALQGQKSLIVLSNAEVRDYVFQIVEQWFSLSRLQVIVAVLVAVLGIINSLTVSITDRRRELGIVQAVGGLRLQVRRTIWLEALSIGVIGLVLGIALGAVNIYYTLGMVRRDLGGLDLDYIFPVSMAAVLIPVILVAAFIAALGPGESAVRGSLVEALEYE